jgi:hypothetical protein
MQAAANYLLIPIAQIRAGNAALRTGHAKAFLKIFKIFDLNNTGNDRFCCGNPLQSLSVGRINNRLPARYMRIAYFTYATCTRRMQGGKLRVKALSTLINEKLTTY